MTHFYLLHLSMVMFMLMLMLTSLNAIAAAGSPSPVLPFQEPVPPSTFSTPSLDSTSESDTERHHYTPLNTFMASDNHIESESVVEEDGNGIMDVLDTNRPNPSAISYCNDDKKANIRQSRR